jgi:hypothetical protein
MKMPIHAIVYGFSIFLILIGSPKEAHTAGQFDGFYSGEVVPLIRTV